MDRIAKGRSVSALHSGPRTSSGTACPRDDLKGIKIKMNYLQNVLSLLQPDVESE